MWNKLGSLGNWQLQWKRKVNMWSQTIKGYVMARIKRNEKVLLLDHYLMIMN